MWFRVCSARPELLEYGNHASAPAKYCNQAAGVQEQLLVSIKKGSTTRQWKGLIDRAHSINESCNMSIRILSEPHRDRAMLVTSVSRRLSAEILMFLRPFGKLFQVLQFNSKPTINFSVLTYYKAFELAQPCRSDHSVIATLIKEFQQLMDKSFFESSLNAHHWFATFLDPLYRHFEILRDTTREEVSFKSRLFSDVEKWSLQHMEKVAGKTPADQSSEPLEKRTRYQSSEDPFSDFRDDAARKNAPSPHCRDNKLLHQVCVMLKPFRLCFRTYELIKRLLT